MHQEKILVIEDEEDIIELLAYNLSKEGFQVTGMTSGESGIDSARKNPPDLVLLDLMLPGLDGLQVCKALKNDISTKDIPVVMVTAKGEENDIVAGLEIGADDYISKPFSPKVLVARVKSVLRRKKVPVPSDASVIRFKDLSIHPGRHEVQIKDKALELTLSEFRILHLLLRKPGWVFTRYQIVKAIHGEDYNVTDRAIDVQIVGLRKKLGTFGKNIETVRGVGYRMKE